MVALFPGQGSQKVGMGKELFENFQEARRVFEEASDALKKDLKKLCFDGPESDLTLTENTQPALLTVSIAAYRAACAHTGFSPGIVAGHSLGEYSALVAAGSLPLSLAVRLVALRGRSMQTAVPVGQGGMSALLGIEDAAAIALCAKATEEAKTARAKGEAEDLEVECIVEPANYNSPGQIVASGSRDALLKLTAAIAESGIPRAKCIPLDVSAPFHCRLMAPARDAMMRAFQDERAPFQAPSVPYLPNRTGRPSQEAGLIRELLLEQIDHPVLWRASMESLVLAGFRQAVEFGPGKVLQGLCKRNPVHVPGEAEAISLESTGVEGIAGIQNLEKGASAS